jgi:CHAT domain-containing protein
MKKLLVILFICQLQVAYAQPKNMAEITKHYRVLDSLEKKFKYADIIQYAREVAPFFKKTNSYPFYHYFKLQVEYMAFAYSELSQYTEAENVLLAVIPEIEYTASRASPLYISAAVLYSTICLKTGAFTKAYDYTVNMWKTTPLWWKFNPGDYSKLCSGLIMMCSFLGKYDEAITYADKFESTITPTRYTRSDLTIYHLTLLSLYTQMGSYQKMALYMQRTDSLLSYSIMEIGLKIQIKNTQAGFLLMAGKIDSAKKILAGVKEKLDSLNMKKTEAYHSTINSLAHLLVYQKRLRQADSLLTSFFAGRGTVKNNYTWAPYFAMSLIKHAEADYKAALSYTDTALFFQPKIAWSSQQVELPIINVNRSQILLKLTRFEEAWLVYEKLIAEYVQYIRKNIGYLSEPDKNNLLYNYYNLANFAPAFITAVKKEVAPSIIKKTWTEVLFFRGIAMGEQEKLYKTLRRGSDSALMKLYNEIIEIKRTIEFTKKNPMMGGNIGSLSLVLEKKELQLQQQLPAATAKDTMDIITKLYQHLQPGEAIIDFTGFTNISNAPVNSKLYGAYILRYDNPNPLFQTLCAEETLKNTFGKGNPNLLYPSSILPYNSSNPGYALYKLLWKPLTSSLNGIKTVYIIPDGFLHKIAFHALPVSKGAYLSDSMDIRYLYHAASICREDFRKTVRLSNVQVWAGINYGKAVQHKAEKKVISEKQQKKELLKVVDDAKENWDSLPDALKDARSLEKFCARYHITYRLFTDTGATESACKKYIQDSSDLVAFVTHGKFDTGYFKNSPNFSTYMNMPFSITRNPMDQTGLIMAGRNKLINSGTDTHFGDDGVLRAAEIAGLNLENKKLVVLSTCESGLGEVISAEGVYGMARAFKLAGAEKVLISLWKLDDAIAGIIMEEFYKQLLQGKSAAAALKAAQQLMRKKRGPYYWAGLILIE